jgi:hypothetical protein
MANTTVTNLTKAVYNGCIRGKEFCNLESTFENGAAVRIAVGPIQDMLVWPANDAHNSVFLK